jgi:EmrB/QacA subfamily drug resistance transporter
MNAAVIKARANSTLLLTLICIAQFMVILDVAVVNVALPEIKGSLHFSTAGLQWVVNAYTLTFAGLLMLGGRAADLLGRRRVLLAGVFLFTVASLACALATSSAWLIAARAVQGIGGAIISPASLSILTTSFREGAERNRALGAWGAVGGIGGASGALLGGLLTQGAGWGWIFGVNVPVGLAVLALGPRIIPEGRAELGHRHFDLSGAVLVTVGFVAVVYGIVRTEVLGWGALGSLGPLAAGVALLGAFVFVEGRVAKAPLVPLAIFRLRLLRAANTAVLILYAGMFAMWFFLSLFLQQVLGDGPIATGLAFMPTALAVAIAATFAPRLIATIGARTTIGIGMTLTALGLLELTLVKPGVSLAITLLGSIVASAGLGLTLIPATVTAVQGVPRQLAGAASGLLNTSRLLGGALGLAILTTVADTRTRDALATGTGRLQALTDGYSEAFLVGALIVAAGLVIALALFRRPGATSAADAPAQDIAPAPQQL